MLNDTVEFEYEALIYTIKPSSQCQNITVSIMKYFVGNHKCTASYNIIKGWRFVARALWRSEARRVVPWLRPSNVYGSCRVSDQGTTLHASDLHNARATILNPFYNMEYKMIQKIRQNKTWIEADIPCINLTANRYIALTSAIVYASNDVTTPFNPVLKSTDRRSNITIFLHVQGLNHVWQCLYER